VLGHQTLENTKGRETNGLGSEMAQEKGIETQTPQDAQKDALAAEEVAPRHKSAHRGQ
jgi:hypothetical protein